MSSSDSAAFDLKAEAHRHSLGESSRFDEALAAKLDLEDSLQALRSEFRFPSKATVGVKGKCCANVPHSEPSVYMCGNSLGLQSRRSAELVREELDVWATRGVLGHFDHPHGRPWARIEEKVVETMADLVGAKPSEVIAMATLTQNLHTMLHTFYRPTVQRHKIMFEEKAFPSDQYAIASQIALRSSEALPLSPSTSLKPIAPRKDERTLRTEDILQELERSGNEIALLLLSGVQYYTGQLFDIEKITSKAKEMGVIVGWDLAHAAANVPLALHDWNVDFAVWCTYKYLNSGPGGIAGAFVHERWGNKADEVIRPAGWWGHDRSTRFAMPDTFQPLPGAAGFQVSNPSVLDMVSLLGSLETFARVDSLAARVETPQSTPGRIGYGKIMPRLRAKSRRLTAYLEALLTSPEFMTGEKRPLPVAIITPLNPDERGAQLSILIRDDGLTGPSMSDAADQVTGSHEEHAGGDVPEPCRPMTLVARVNRRLQARGIVGDVRNPDMLRLAPAPLYNSFLDVWKTAFGLREALRAEVDSDGWEESVGNLRI